MNNIYISIFLLVTIFSCTEKDKIIYLDKCYDVRKEGEFLIDYYVIVSAPNDPSELINLVEHYNNNHLDKSKIKKSRHYVQMFYRETFHTPRNFSCTGKDRISTHTSDRVIKISWRRNRTKYTLYDKNGFIKDEVYGD